MATKQPPKAPAKAKPKATVAAAKTNYESNPFLLAFRSLGRLFDVNKNWAIAIIAVVVIGGILGFTADMVRFIINANDLDNRNSSSYYDRKRSLQRHNDVDSYAAPRITEDEALQTADKVKDDVQRNLPVIIAGVVIVSIIVLSIVAISMVAGTFINGVISYVIIKSIDGQTVGFTEALQATANKFWLLLGAQFLAGLKILGWSLLFIIPGIIAALRYAILPYVIMAEEKMGVGASHDRTKSLVKGRLWEIYGLSFVAGLVPFIGSVLGMTGYGAAYRQLQVTHDGTIERPKVHWLNYIGLIFVGLGLALMMLILFVVAVLLANSKSY